MKRVVFGKGYNRSILKAGEASAIAVWIERHCGSKDVGLIVGRDPDFRPAWTYVAKQGRGRFGIYFQRLGRGRSSPLREAIGIEASYSLQREGEPSELRRIEVVQPSGRSEEEKFVKELLNAILMAKMKGPVQGM